MMPNLITTGNTLTMTSREIADLVGKRHDKVKQSIERLAIAKRGADQAAIDLPPMGEYLDSLGRPAMEYVFTGDKGKRDSIVVVAQLSPEFTARLVDRWQELEQAHRAPALPSDYISALEHLLETKRSEQAAIAERDQAIATKALIGSKREATAMATASAAKRKVRALQDQLGVNQRHATVIAVERATGQSLARNTYVELRRWCKANDQNPVEVVDARYGTVKAWPAGAWLAVHGIDLSVLFSSAEEAA